jgi:ribonuclease HII
MTKQEREQILKEKLIAMKAFDGEFSSSDEVYVAGIDEAGRGPLAGPVVAACVVLPKDFNILGVDDSKKLSEKKRNQLFDEISEHALAVGVGIADNNLIDEINILQATKSAMKLAFEQANSILQEKTGMSICHLLIDAVELKDINIPQSAVIKGDAKSLSIAAASIIAKVTRDKIMLKYHEKYPYYAFDSNKGYGTKAHYEGIASHGITDIHRKTFLKNI